MRNLTLQLTDPHYNYSDQMIFYEAFSDARTFPCGIHLYTLRDSFSVALNPNDVAGSAIDGFRANHDAIRDLTWKKILSCDFEPDGSILIESSDAPNPGIRYRVG